jgi:sodium/bile acid cotransporter 7
VNFSGLLARFKIDPYILALISTVAVASLIPARGEIATGFGWVTKVAIALLFFLHGAKLSREAVIAGISHWRLHLTVLLATFALFPVLGLIAVRLPPEVLLFLCCLPSTVQSSIAFTSIARGNIAAAVCAASASNLFGILLTPILVSVLMGVRGAGGLLGQVEAVVVQLLLPFLAGQIARRWIGPWIEANKRVMGFVDRGSILLVVYTAFSEAVVQGIWGKVSALELVKLLGVCAALLAIILAATVCGARAMGFCKEDEITIAFCGSKKSLASGVPMAGILFPPATVGLLILPLMLFHQIQLMACAFIAQKYAARTAD